MKPIIEIQNISKKFRIQHEKQAYLSIRDSLSSLFKPSTSSSEEFYALKDVSFEVYAGESIGIIGKNGAGKSTLLKILSKITPPSSGKIILRGRIASLLEVGTGFHPELSGRENIFLNGSILGMKRNEIESKFDEIVDFSGVEKFIDTPLKHYSSGMQLRLAFAVAAFLEPEVLIIDEVLAVGDAEFQKKCLGKMSEVSKSGRTILFVSHDLTAVTSLTKKAILLENGIIKNYGETRNIIEEYTNKIKQSDKEFIKTNSSHLPQIVSVKIKTSLANNIQIIKESLEIIIQIDTPKIPELPTWLSIDIKDTNQKTIIHLWTNSKQISLCKKVGKQNITCIIPSLKLYKGLYTFSMNLSGPPGHILYDSLQNICPFEVMLYGYGLDREFEWGANLCSYMEDAKWEEV